MPTAKKVTNNCEYFRTGLCRAVAADDKGMAFRERSCRNKSKILCCYLCDFQKTCAIRCAYLDKDRKVERAREANRKKLTMTVTTTDAVPGMEIAKILVSFTTPERHGQAEKMLKTESLDR